MRGVGDRCCVSPHDAGEGLDLRVIGNHPHLFVHGDGVAIEQLESFTGFAPAHLQATFDFVEIKNVRRTAQLEHHVVGDIDQWAHAALTATGQSVHHPLRGGSLGVHALHDATAEATAEIGGVNFHCQLISRLRRHRRECRHLEWRTRQSGHLAGNAIHTQAMRQIGRELEGHEGVVQIQMLANVLPQRRVRGQLEQTAVVIGNLQFFGRAQHALAFDATQFPHLDDKGLAIFTRWQLGPHQSAWNPNAHTGVGCATHDVEQTALPHIDLANPQAVGIGVLLGRHDLSHHNFGERWGNGLKFFHFQTRHGQRVGQLLCRQVRIAKLAQPGFRKLHTQGSLRWADRRKARQRHSSITGIGSRNGHRHQRTGASRSRRNAAW